MLEEWDVNGLCNLYKVTKWGVLIELTVGDKSALVALMKGGEGGQGVMNVSGEKEKPRARPWQSSDSLYLVH